jgi:NADH-quinone oxidoreductase subunit N
MLLCSSNDLLTAYLAIELSSLSFYILALSKKSSNYSVEGGIIYFVTGAVSSAFCFGSSYIYGATGTINFTDLETYSVSPLTADLYNGSFDYSFIELGLTLILFSLHKISFSSFPLWSLDVYEGSPSSTFFSLFVAKLSVFCIISATLLL